MKTINQLQQDMRVATCGLQATTMALTHNLNKTTVMMEQLADILLESSVNEDAKADVKAKCKVVMVKSREFEAKLNASSKRYQEACEAYQAAMVALGEAIDA